LTLNSWTFSSHFTGSNHVINTAVPRFSPKKPATVTIIPNACASGKAVSP
jgi:hypothetical protein